MGFNRSASVHPRHMLRWHHGAHCRACRCHGPLARVPRSRRHITGCWVARRSAASARIASTAARRRTRTRWHISWGPVSGTRHKGSWSAGRARASCKQRQRAMHGDAAPEPRPARRSVGAPVRIEQAGANRGALLPVPADGCSRGAQWRRVRGGGGGRRGARHRRVGRAERAAAVAGGVGRPPQRPAARRRGVGGRARRRPRGRREGHAAPVGHAARVRVPPAQGRGLPLCHAPHAKRQGGGRARAGGSAGAGRGWGSR